MSRIAAVKGVLPEHRGTQEDIAEMFADVVLGADPQRRALLQRLHAASGVNTRHLALPMDSYRGLRGFGDANDAFIEVGLRLGEAAVRSALDAAGLRAGDVDLVMSVSVTGIAAPSLEARLVDRLGLRPDVKRVPVFGLGCVAGAAGLARLHDYLVGYPDGVAVLLSVELCSLTLQRDDPSSANLVASGLFGDGAAAVVMVGERRARLARRGGAGGAHGAGHPQPDLPRHRAGARLGHRGRRLPDRAGAHPQPGGGAPGRPGRRGLPRRARAGRSPTSTPGWRTPAGPR